MKPVKFKVLFQILLIVVFAVCLLGCLRSKNKEVLSAYKKVQVIELKGSGYERGLQYGKQLKIKIAEAIEKWKINIEFTTKRNADSVIAELLKVTNFEPAIKRWTPELMDEVKGIADGSGQRFDDIFSFQLVDEFWVYLDRLTNTKLDHCSSLGVSAKKNHPAYVAQNIDLENYMNGYQILLHILGSKTTPEQYILTCAGLVATTGMNDKGIGVCVNALMELQASRDGLPVAFVIRGILNKQNGIDALAFLKTVKHASGQNYIIGIQDSVYDFEASSNQIIRFCPKAKIPGIVYHTNHALVNHDVKPWYSIYHGKVLAGETASMNSEIRFSTLEKRLDYPFEEISSDAIKATLRSEDDENNPICRAYKERGVVFTFSSVLYTLTGKHSVQVTFGSPDNSEYHEYFFKK